MKLEETIGNTPLVELGRLCQRPGVRLFAKLEGKNPAGSVKDRPAYFMIKNARDRGEIGPGVTLVEPTSGNTGIALAMIATMMGFPIELVMPDNSTAERVQTMRAYGAKVILTPAAGGMEAAIDHAREKVARGGYVMLDQFSNDDNWRAHYESTGPEIWRDTAGAITHFVSAMGTTGTIMGTSRYLKEQNPAVQIVGVHPAEGARIPGIRRWPEAYLPRIFDASRVDRTLEVSQADAEQAARDLAQREGILAGVSTGGALHAALRVAGEIDAGVVVFIACDRGDRYLSSGVFGGGA